MRVVVLLSMYNGKQYIEEQINSILAQKNVDSDILIRDDGSSDNSVQIVREKYGNRVKVIQGENVGVTASFFKLINCAGSYDYYAFSDQDDYWDDDKLFTAINKLGKYENIPALYSSNARLVDSKLEFIKNETSNPKITLGSAIVKNFVTGCTTVFNHELFKYIKNKLPNDVKCHDWWLNLVTLSIGGVSIYDTEPHISYRQHDGNVTGAAVTNLKKWRYRLHNFLSNEYRRDNMASDLLNLYSENISQDDKMHLIQLSNYKKKKFSIIKDPYFRTGNSIDDLLFSICILLNKI